MRKKIFALKKDTRCCTRTDIFFIPFIFFIPTNIDETKQDRRWAITKQKETLLLKMEREMRLIFLVVLGSKSVFRRGKKYSEFMSLMDS